MAVLDLGSFLTLVDHRYSEIDVEEFASVKDQIPMCFTVRPSMAFEERTGSVGALPEWQEFEGSHTYARFHEQYNVVTVHREFSQGLRWTRQMMDDDQTGIMRGDTYRMMVNSCIITRQRHAARLWNFMTSNDTMFYRRSEGVPIASASHTTRTPGVSTAVGFSNIILDELSPTSYRAARQQMRRFADDQGFITDMVPDMLVLPIEQEQRGMEILMSPGNADNANRVSNPEAGTARIMVPIYWTDTNDWALVNERMMKQDCTWWDRVKPEFKRVLDFETEQLKATGYGRWSFGVRGWRWVMYGSAS